MAAVAAVAAGCGGGTATTSSTTATDPVTAAPTSSTSTVPPTTVAPTTTIYQPTSPQGSAAAAASSLLAAWLRGDRGAAASVASPAAVASLFAFPGRPLQPRGCSDGQLPLTCSYADRSASGRFYEVDATQTAAGGWYVVSVEVA